MNKFLFSCALLLSGVLTLSAADIRDFRVQHSDSPISVEDRHPLFSWRMESSVRGAAQTAYQLSVVREVDGSELWNTGRVESAQSVDIPYMGVALQPGKGYTVNLSVWDRAGQRSDAQTRFETGLMNPKASAWGGAQWIGVPQVKLDAASLMLFEIETSFRFRKGDVASLVLGADDMRLENAFLNDFGVESDENYLQIDFDYGKKEIRIWRVGYYKEDRKDVPYITVSKEKYPDANLDAVFSARPLDALHDVSIRVEASNINFVLDGTDVVSAPPRGRGGFGGGGGMFTVGMTGGGGRRQASNFAIGKLGTGGDYPSYPNLCSIGFAAGAGQEVVYSDYRILRTGQSEDRVAFPVPYGTDYGIFAGKPGISVSGKDITVSGSTRVWADPSHGGETMLRTEFSLQKPVRQARLYASAMGVYTLFLNGERVGEDWFAPGAGQYRETISYQTYDVTAMLKEGRNALGAELAPGWYTGYMTFTPGNFNFFGDYEALLSRLVVTYEDGSSEAFVSDPALWKACRKGPVVSGSFFQGERYDASREKAVAGWKEAGFDDSGWLPAERIEKREWIDFDIVARYDQLVRLRETLTAQRVMPTHSADGHTYIYNMGVNMVGVPSVTIPAGWLQKGDRVVLAYGEQVYPGQKGDKKEYVNRFGKKGRGVAGHILMETNRGAMDMDVYIADGSGEVTIQPSTTFRGYQYIQVTLPSHQGPLPLENVKGLVLSSSEIPTGRYTATTSDGNRTAVLANQLFKNIQRSQLGNFFTIPTDCPQRNERMGWTGDAQAYTRTGIYNAHTQNFYRQWMVALRADQGVGNDREVPGGIGSTVPTFNKADDTSFANGTTWSAAVCQVPWQMYIQYGDTQVVEENFDTMLDWLNGMAFYKNAEYPYLSTKAGGLADHLALDNRTPADLLNNAIYIYMMEVTAIMADAIGRTAEAEMLRERRAHAVDDWNRAYVDPATGKTKGQSGNIIHTQASYATPLNFNVFKEENRERAAAWLAALAAEPAASGPTPEEQARQSGRQDELTSAFGTLGSGNTDFNFKPWTITTGFSGTPNILPALSRNGYAEEAFRMFGCTDFASWLYPVTEGATSIWERWNSYDNAFADPSSNSMNSFNHFALGAVGQWMYEFQLGITTDHGAGEAGYQHFVLQPSAAGVFTSIEGSYESNYGTVRSAWKAVEGRMTSYECTVPANTSATVYIPVKEDVTGGSSCEGADFKGFTVRNGLRTACYEVAAGSYGFTIDSTVSVR